MKKKLFALTVLPALALVAIAPSAYAFGGQGMGLGEGREFRNAPGMHEGPRRGNGAGMRAMDLVTPEMREAWREDCDSLTAEEREARREEMREMRDEHRAEMEDFIGLSREEMRERHMDGDTMGDILEEQGITESEAESFLTQEANERVDNIVERHNLDADEEKTIRDRIAEFVQNMLERWYN